MYGYYVGRKIGQNDSDIQNVNRQTSTNDSLEKNTNSDDIISIDFAPDIKNSNTFYATIEEIRNTYKREENDNENWISSNFVIQGLDVNDLNHRGKYTFSIYEKTELIWHNTKITALDLDVGDRIAITYAGYVFETYPEQLQTIVKIEVLDDNL